MPMMSVHGLVVRVERSVSGDRRLDAEVVAYVLGRRGSVINPIEDIDGWGIDEAPDGVGQATTWMAAADVPGVTYFLDAAVELVAQARPADGASVMARALRFLQMPDPTETPGVYASRAARSVTAELLRAVSADREPLQASRAA